MERRVNLFLYLRYSYPLEIHILLESLESNLQIMHHT